MDIRPPKKRKLPEPLDEVSQIAGSQFVELQTIDKATTPTWRKRLQRPKTLAYGGGALIALGISLLLGWYSWAIGPKSQEPQRPIRVVIEAGDTSVEIARKLDDAGIVKSAFAMRIYTEITGTKNKLQAGGYAIKPSQTVKDIVQHIVDGKTDEFDITVLPGLTLSELRDYFKQSGYSDTEITTAYNASYEHPLLESKPAGTTLEGYIYPETYRMHADSTLDELFVKSFDEMYKRLQSDGLITGYQSQGLTIYQAITLASIVQKEVSDPVDQKQVAQVFLKRLKEGIMLGSDVTFIYAAKQMGVEPKVSLDSPYNTRRYTGLPPGPISNMNPSALVSVAQPAPGDFLFFVAGDGPDAGTTYYSRTEAEHNANVAAHCRELCQ